MTFNSGIPRNADRPELDERPYQCGAFDVGSGAQCVLESDHEGGKCPLPPDAKVFVPPDAANKTLRSTIRHRDYIKQALSEIAHELEQRATVHDLSKFLDDEFEGFSRINVDRPEFGTPEYHERMRSEKPTILRHYSRNSHHPEHGPMTFLDVIEMVADWWASGKGYENDMEWMEAVKINLHNKRSHLFDWQVELARDVAYFLGRKLS